MRLTSLLAGLLIAASAPALAQVNTVPQIGTISSILKQPTYTATAVGLVPAASATDIFCLNSSATRTVAVRRVTIAGTAGTAVTTPFLLNRNATRDTGGTPAATLALPVPVPLLQTDSAATATLTAYTANPTVTDSAPALMGSMLVDLPVTTAAGGNVETTRLFGSAVDMFSHGITLPKSSTYQLCVNLNAVSVSSGVLTINIEWQEYN